MGLKLSDKFPNTRQLVKQLIIDDLRLTDFQSSLPNTALAGLATNLTSLILLRSLVGVGEAAYGGALGYAIGAVIGSAFSWRIAFIVCGGPGIIAAITTLTINDPVRGINDIADNSEKSLIDNEDNTTENPIINKSFSNPFDVPPTTTSNNNNLSNKSTYQQFKVVYDEMIQILSNKHFMLATAGLISNNFALGGLAEWLATYLLRYDNVSIDAAGLVVGAATIVGGLFGTVIGSKIADYAGKFIPGAYFLIPALFQIPGSICLMLTINISGYFGLVCVILFIGEICIWAYLAPISAISISSIPPSLRARSCGVQILLQHILGDIISPPIIGAISDYTGSLRNGLQVTWIGSLMSAVFWGCGYLFLSPIVKHKTTDSNYDIKEPSYVDLLCGEDTLILVNDVVVRRHNKSSISSNSSSNKESFDESNKNELDSESAETKSMQDAMTLPLLSHDEMNI
eukprot:gene21410-27735_t